MKKYIFLLFLFTALGVFSSRLGLAGLPFEKTWTATGGDGEFGWYLTYEFHGGEYTLEGYPPLWESGSYSVVLAEGNSYTVLLEPDGESGDLMKFTLLEDGTLVMSGYSATDGTTFN